MLGINCYTLFSKRNCHIGKFNLMKYVSMKKNYIIELLEVLYFIQVCAWYP